MDDWKSADATFREFELVADRLKKPGQELLRVCARAIISGLETISFAIKQMALKAAARADASVSPRERHVLVMEMEPRFPGLPPRRIETSMRESLNIAIAVYARARGSEAPLDKSPLGDPVLPKCVLDAVTIHDRITHPSENDDLELSAGDVASLKQVVRWAERLREWLNAERRAELAETREAINVSVVEARRRLLDRE